MRDGPFIRSQFSSWGNPWRSRFAPFIVGVICFLIGATILFSVSFGKWRVKSWPKFDENKYSRLEPWRMKTGNITYWSSDAAMLTGFLLMIASVLTILTVWCIIK
jgi:hypothetical protein